MNNKNVITVGFAVFTMFFGAGNLVLPLLLSQKWIDNWFSAFLGFVISAVFCTLLGLIASVLSGSTKNFFNPLGGFIGIVVQIVLMLIEGPFGIVPRSMIISFGAVESAFEGLSKIVFYLVTIPLIYVLASNKNRIVNVLGKFITPLMLIFITFQVIYTFYTQQAIFPPIQITFESFYEGLVLGYLTYDLPGAIYFTAIAVGYLKVICKNDKEIIPNGLKASCVTIAIMIIMYVSFLTLGIIYNEIIKDLPTEKILPTLVKTSFGGVSHILFVVFVYLACITTAVAAISIWSEFITFLISPYYKVKQLTILKISLLLAFITAMNNFDGLIKLLAPILQVIYPLLILLSIYNIYKNRKKFTWA